MIENLLKYQQADAQLREIEKTLAKSDERGRAVEAKKFLDGVNESVNKLDAKAGELLSAYESIVSEREKLEEQKRIERARDTNSVHYSSTSKERLGSL